MKQDKNVIIGLIFFVIVISSLSSTNASVNICSGKNQNAELPIVLVTGFEPFDIYEVNPSQLVAESLDAQIIDGAYIVGIVLPVDFDKSVENVTKAIGLYNPVLVISLGLSPSTHVIDIENCGINLKKLSRNESPWIFPRILDPSGPFLRLSTLNEREVVVEIRNVDIPVKQSFFAGMYVCNAVLYKMLGYIDEHALFTKAGFIHLPLLSSQDPCGMDLENMIEAVTIAITINL